MLVLLTFSFISGVITILAPCIWPLLPIIFISSDGTKKKSIGITLGIATSFAFLTLLVSYLFRFFMFDPNIIRYVASIILVILGLTFIIPKLSEILEGFVSKIVAKFAKAPTTTDTTFLSGYLSGFALGSVWAPCAGPILAAIATLTATQDLDYKVLLLIFFYILGLSIPLFLFSFYGGKVSTKFSGVSKNSKLIQQVFGVLMIVIAVGIYTNYDKKVQAYILDALPSYSNFIISIESNDAVQKELDKLQYGEEDEQSFTPTNNNLKDLGPAPEIIGINNWLNTDEPLNLEKLRGKVVLVDFWTYTCINCIRTLPYTTSWYEKYKDDGFVLLGVHSPEFEFEKSTENVQKAIETYKITYPVAQDNDFKTWRNYKNRYWPAHYLIDAKGNIRYVHFGEGKYDETENAIRTLLEEAGNNPNDELTILEDNTPRGGATPETYLGLGRMERFASKEAPKIGLQTFTLPSYLAKNNFAYEGQWTIDKEYSSSTQNSALHLNFTGKKVFLVITPAREGDKIQVQLDGQRISRDDQGEDVVDGEITLDEARLYTIVDMNRVESHVLTLKFLDPDTKIFAFTFGTQ